MTSAGFPTGRSAMPAAGGSFPRTGVVSHVLPPSPSGQATVLYRLLRPLPPDRCCLISRSGCGDKNGGTPGTERLAASYHRLDPPSRLPAFGRLEASPPWLVSDALLAVRAWARQIERIVRREACELLIACSGDLHDLPAAAVAARRAAVPFIPYMFDDYLFQWTGFRRRIAQRLEPFALRDARAVVVPNEFLEEEYRRRYGVRCAVIRNPCPLPDLDTLDRMESPFPDGGAAIVYTGSVYHAQHDAFRNLVAALARLGRPEVRLHIYTSQSEADLGRLGLRGPGIVHHPHIAESEVPRVLRHADVLFLPLAFDSPIPEVIRTSAPGKMGEYLAAGRPVLVHAPRDSFVCWYFRKYGCGLVVDRNDPGSLAEALEALTARGAGGSAREMAASARAAAERDFSLEKAGAAFAALLGKDRGDR